MEVRLTIWEMSFPESRLVEPYEIDKKEQERRDNSRRRANSPNGYIVTHSNGAMVHQAANGSVTNLSNAAVAVPAVLDDNESDFEGSDPDESDLDDSEDFALRVACSLHGFLAIQLANNAPAALSPTKTRSRCARAISLCRSAKSHARSR